MGRWIDSFCLTSKIHLALFYNKTVFKEAKFSRPPATWMQLWQYFKKLTQAQNNDRRIDRYGLRIIPEIARLYFIIKAYGGVLVDESDRAAFATPETFKGLQVSKSRHFGMICDYPMERIS